MKAPAFSLSDQDGKMHTLSDYVGKWLIIYFYPKDDTPGCTKEACSLRDNVKEFEKFGVSILGISKDSVSSHKKFAEKYQLNFPLLADPDHQVIESFGAWGRKKFMGREFDGILRNTYVINPKGEIEKEYKGVNPLTHADELLADLKILLDKE
ncbi:MAG TPA: thioredoxin-dependent thiol peroxidase [Patescibacteria group bacterium]|nr:thioredoxin-dependent thiol peroxidase [Patescibacteria group bacterium]